MQMKEIIENLKVGQEVWINKRHLVKRLKANVIEVKKHMKNNIYVAKEESDDIYQAFRECMGMLYWANKT